MKSTLRMVFLLLWGTLLLRFPDTAGAVVDQFVIEDNESGPAPQFITFLEFTNVWKFDQSGLELGTDWRTIDYDDSAWPSGPGLLGFESTPQPYTVHAPINTQLAISMSVTTYYFRTTFMFTGSTEGLSLVASNLVDDGAVIYLNGEEAGRIRVPLGQNATTLSQGPTTEGQLDVVTITNLPLLRQGANWIASEVHQSSPVSGDIMWAMKLMAIVTQPLVITKQPNSQSVFVGSSVEFGVGVSGGIAIYQWRKNGVPIANATNSIYAISSAALTSGGDYTVVVTNSVSSVTSRVATLTVYVDTTGPRMLSAIVDTNTIPSHTLINVAFSEPLAASSVTNISNYVLALFANTRTVTLTNAKYAFTDHPRVFLYVDIGDANWSYLADYVLTVNKVTDAKTNVIAPDSQIAVVWPRPIALLAPDAVWSYHTAAAFNPEVFGENWPATNYLEGPWWAQGRGVFYGGPVSSGPCVGTFQTAVGYQPEPVLFRTTFVWPANFGSNALLSLIVTFDDGLVLYLNSQEIWRNNLPPPPSPVSLNSRSLQSIASPLCLGTGFNPRVTLAVSNLLPGTNWLAAAVVQSPAEFGDADTVFGLQLAATAFPPGPLLESSTPLLNVTPLGVDAVRLWWTGAGYALESTTNLTDNLASLPLGPWQEVHHMSNPYTNTLSEPTRFFRLKK